MCCRRPTRQRGSTDAALRVNRRRADADRRQVARAARPGVARAVCSRARASRCCSSAWAPGGPLDAEAIAALCASRGVPAMVTYKAKGVVPDVPPHFAGVFTNGALERPLDRGGRSAARRRPRSGRADSAAVDLRAADRPHRSGARRRRHIPFAAQLVTDIPSGMQLLGELLPPIGVGPRRSPPDVSSQQRQRLCPRSDRLAAHRVVQIAADAAAPQARVTVDAGAHMFPATMLWPVAEPNGMLISNGLSTMGFRAAGGDRRGAGRSRRRAGRDSRSRRAGGRADRRRRSADVRRRAAHRRPRAPPHRRRSCSPTRRSA